MEARTRHLLLPIVCALSLSACSSTKTPATADVASSRTAIEAAVAAGAAETAPAILASARDKLMRAETALARKDYDVAQQLAMEAQADAKLAQHKARSTRATAAAGKMQEDIHALREEINRANGTVTR